MSLKEKSEKVKTKRKKKPNFTAYELTDYLGKTVCFNNHGSVSLFGTSTPTPKMLAFVENSIQNPDWVYQSLANTRIRHVIKRVRNEDYILELVAGYAGSKDLWQLRTIEKIKVKEAKRNALHYDQPLIKSKIKRIYPVRRSVRVLPV